MSKLTKTLESPLTAPEIDGKTRKSLSSEKSEHRKGGEFTPGLEEYLTIEGLGKRLRLQPKTIKNKMASGIFRRGVHYFSPKGIGPRFKWSAVVAWLEKREQVKKAPTQDEDGIPMARGYNMGSDSPH